MSRTQSTGMKAWLSRFLAYSVVFFAVVASGGETAMPDFSSYEENEALKSIISEHASGQFWCFLATRRIQPDADGPKNELRQHEDLLLAITVFFRDRASSALRYLVTPTGTTYNCRDLYNWAIQDSQEQQLSEQQLTDLKAAIKALPDKNAYPPLTQLAIVSFRIDAAWVTRTMPATELKRIFAIIGERFETKKSQ